MKLPTISIVFIALLFAVVVIIPIVCAQKEANVEATEEFNIEVIDVHDIKLPQLEFDSTQEKVIVNDELNPVEPTQPSLVSQDMGASRSQTVSKIPYGSIIYHSKEGVTTVFDEKGKQLFAAEDAKSVKVTTPRSETPATFVHEIPSGSIIKEQEGKIFVIYNGKLILTLINDSTYDLQSKNFFNSRLAASSGSNGLTPLGTWLGWIEYAESTPTTLTLFEATWEAPLLTPSNSDVRESLAIYNGIEHDEVDGVMQPVLMWNFCKKGDDQVHLYYTGAAWDYRSMGQQDELHSTLISVSPGDTIRGKMQWKQFLNLWIIQFDNLETGQSTSILTDRFPKDNLKLYMTLEASARGVKPNDQSLTESITFDKVIIKNKGDIVPVTFTGYTWPGASNYFTNLEAKVYQNPLRIVLRTQPITYIIKPQTGFHGTISPSTPQNVPAGGSQTFTISPDQGYVVEDVKINKDSIGAVTSYTFNNVDKDSTIRATFKRQPTYTITSNAGSHGTISPSTPQKVVAGGSQTFTISANTGYAISDVLVDGASVGAVNIYTFENVQANHRIRATFKSSPSTFTILSNSGSGGSISPSGSVTVPAGGSQTFTITSDSGYMVADVFVDGISQGAISTYTFTNVQASHTISASFKPVSVSGTDWVWSRDGWGDWQHIATWGGPEVGENSEYGPVMVNDPIKGLHGEHGTITHLNAGSIEASVWRTFTDSSGSGWNTIMFNGALGASDVPGGRWMTIDVNGQQVFAANELQTPPGNTGQIFEIKVSFPQTQTATVRITQGQNPAWGAGFPMEFYSVKLSRESTVMMKTESVPFVIPDGKSLVMNGTASQQ